MTSDLYHLMDKSELKILKIGSYSFLFLKKLIARTLSGDEMWYTPDFKYSLEIDSTAHEINYNPTNPLPFHKTFL
jgi:hypothetical protein